MAWDVDYYDDGEGCEMHFAYRALMPPYDISDPGMDPMVAAQADGHEYTWGGAYSKGHFDQSGVYEGEVVLRERRIRSVPWAPWTTAGVPGRSGTGPRCRG